MKIIDRIATALDLVGIPTGRLCPGNLVADVCGSFIQADRLSDHGIDVPGRIWSLSELRTATISYTGIDLVSEVLDEELRPGQTVDKFWSQRAAELIEKATRNPASIQNELASISKDIRQAQKRLGQT